ncbi:NgoMIV family type II restriction endonuclease [Saccharopolyspora spinosa]|uniref:NgoMIV restriction enzyme n=1 Tax=Saccharopolyspora spinosa TaxID=60894 RepID=A0A2N3XTU4_SACSN|nr:NgoMIV family type II restriction endonuclease [Saccharopolyspora spinosa]PKW14114.1 NgoMIV restriction enzyme [Saccharopolyspora spinosa]
MTAYFAKQLLGWKASRKNKLGWSLVPNSADVDSAESLRLAAGVLDALGVMSGVPSKVPASPGSPLEQCVETDLKHELPRLDVGRHWEVRNGALITEFAQYTHLKAVDALVQENPELRITIGRDYLIRPDVTVALQDLDVLGSPSFLHAAVSCKWTIRSDRVQNIRHEYSQMTRHRRGRQPHLVAVTAEPLPSRLASIARGTGEVDAVYHITYEQLDKAVSNIANEDQKAAWKECVGQHRILPYSTLAKTLARW